MSKKLLKSTATVSGMTLLSRILGFARDVVIARAFGAGLGTDAFFVAFKIPNFMRRLFAEGAFSQAFVPVLSEYKTQRPHDDVKRLTSAVIGTLGGVLFVIVLMGILLAPLLVVIFAPGFTGVEDKFELTVLMLRITFPYLLFISLTALAGGLLNSYGQFGVPAFTPVFLNISLILAAIVVSPHMNNPIVGLSWGVLVAGVIQLIFQFPYLKRLGILTWPRWGWREEGVRRIVRLMLPAIFGSSVAQINLLIDTLIASFLVTGSVSWLYYSDRLVEFPLGVLGIALATVILPRLSRIHSQASKEEFSQTLDWALRWAFIIGTPATIGLMVLAGPLLTTLFQYGEFSPQDVTMASLSLMAYSVGLLGFILVKVLAPGFYARQDTRTPVRIGVIALVCNMGMNILFVLPMLYFGVQGPHAGLALATSLGAFVNAGLLYQTLCKEKIYHRKSGWAVFLLRITLATLVMAVLLLWGTGDIASWFHERATYRALRLITWVACGAFAYFISLFMFGLRFTDLGKISNEH